jgi:peptide/nickel transport system substrate-binding protein
LVSVLAIAVLLAVGSLASAQDGDDPAVLRIGLTQDWDSLNPTAGFLVSEYEIWNLHYATLTDKAAEDFATIPGLAESWEASDDGLTYTYTLREGLLWSDGTPLTAEDVAWNINTSVEQGWTNHISTTQNLTATVIDDRTVEIVSAVPDPKLPTMDVYLLPKHIWEPVATDAEAVATYDGLDGVGSGPFTISEFTDQQSVSMVANPNYWGWEGQEPPIDQVIFRYFSNPDAMVAALQQGEIDAAHGIPSNSVETLQGDENIEVVDGQQGGFDEIAINGGAVEGQPHPALLDLEVRRAIGFALDREGVIEDLLFGLGAPLDTISPSADPKWIPEIPEEDRFTYDPDRANQILDDAGYLDSDGDGVREMPDGTNPIVLRHGVNTNSDFGASIGELFSGWMNAIGIGVELESYDSDQLFEVIIAGDYDTFYWGWVPFVDPDPMLSYFTEAELGNYNDANWTDPAYEELYLEQKEELDEASRIETVHEMLTILHDAAVYFPLYAAPDMQAYRTDAFEGWVRQPAEVGPVMFSNSSPSYALLTPVGEETDDTTAPTDTTAGGSSDTTAGGPGDTTGGGEATTTVAAAGDDDTGGSGSLPWIIAGGAVVLVGGALLAMRRRQSADERE